MRFLTFFLMLLLMFVYAIIGGIVFRYIEIYHEEDVKRTANSTIYGIIESRQCLNKSDIEQLERLVWRMEPHGVYLNTNGSIRFRSKFDIRSAILIACGLFNGFGFENGFPETVGGKIFTAFYSLCIGFFQFFVMYIMGELFDVLLKHLQFKMLRKFSAKAVSIFFSFRQLILSVLGLVFFVIIPAAIVDSIEIWTFGECLYFAFIYVLTIGFGDYSPGANDAKGQSEDFLQWYRLCIGFWLMISVMWFAIILYQLYSVVGDFLWESTEEIIDEGIDHVKNAALKNQTNHTGQAHPYHGQSNSRPLPPIPMLTSSSSSSSSLTSVSDQFVFPSMPALTILGQESSGEVSLIKF